MADFRLTPDNPLALPSRRVIVHVVALHPTGPFCLSLVSTNSDFPSAHRLTDSQWLVQMVTAANSDPITVRLTPQGDLTFPSGALFEIALQFIGDGRTPETDLVTLTPTDASGLDLLDVVDLLPLGSQSSPRVRMTVPLGEAIPRHLSSHAQDAFTAARRALGVDHLPASEAIQVNVVVDGSASMRFSRESGHVADVIEVLRGLSAVVASKDGFVAYVADDGVTSAYAEDPGWGEAVTVAMRERGARVGFQSRRPELAAFAERTVTYVVTDGPPADLADLVAAGHGNHLVMLCSQLTVDAWGFAPAIPLTIWEPAALSHHDSRIEGLVTSLLGQRLHREFLSDRKG